MSLYHQYKIRLSRKEEAELVRRMRAGDIDAKHALIESVLPWMRTLAAKFCREPELLDDMTQVAIVALIECLDEFDPAQSRLTSFSAKPAFWRIRRAMNAAGSIVSRSSNKSKSHGAAWERAAHVAELTDVPLAGDCDQFDHMIMREELQQLGRAMQQIPPREADILRRRAAGQTLLAIGIELGITRERVRQIETRAMQRLRELLGVSM